jgi:hypothetical protein
MQIMNALKDPKNAMRVKNSGIAIETATASPAVPVRLRTRIKKTRAFPTAPRLSESIPR